MCYGAQKQDGKVCYGAREGGRTARCAMVRERGQDGKVCYGARRHMMWCAMVRERGQDGKVCYGAWEDGPALVLELVVHGGDHVHLPSARRGGQRHEEEGR